MIIQPERGTRNVNANFYEMETRQIAMLNEIFGDVDLTKREMRTLVWLAGWEESTVANMVSAIRKAIAAKVTKPCAVFGADYCPKRERGELLKRTISFMTGKGSVNHNSRKFHAKNTDPERSYLNVEYCNENIKDVYHELFDEALSRCNEKQTRNDRRIDDYYEKIRSGKQEKPFHEIILQIGDKDTMGAETEEGQLAAKILDEYMQDFQRRNPTLRVFSAHLHMDEATPHLHIDFVPYITGSKRGLDTRVSLKQALSSLGFKGGTRRETELNQWVAAEKQQLAAIMLEHGIEWEQKGTHEKHLSLLDFEKQERAKEVSALEKQKAELEEHNAIMQEVNEKYLDQLENVEKDIFSAQESREEADKQAEQAKKKAAQYEKKLTEIAPMVKEMERFAEKYSADPDETIIDEKWTAGQGKQQGASSSLFAVIRHYGRSYVSSWKDAILPSQIASSITWRHSSVCFLISCPQK